MTRRGALALIVAVLVVCCLWDQPASAQSGGSQDRGRVQPPRELLKAYPFEQGRLRSADGPRTDDSRSGSTRSGGGASSAAVPAPEDPGGAGWLLPALVLSTASALLVLVFARRRLGRRTAGAQGPDPEPEVATPDAVAPARRFERPQTAPIPSDRGSRSTYAVVNQKGGVGKTTVSLVLGVAAARRGSRVLLVDLDPQASATTVLGANDHRPTVADVMRDPGTWSLAAAIGPTEWGIDLAPSEWALREADTGRPARNEPILDPQLAALGDYELVLIDCPPNLGALTFDALTAASHALIVTEPTFLALRALDELLNTLEHVTAERNPSLELAGVLLNRVEGTAEHKRGVAEVESSFGSRVWEPHIPKRAVLQDAMRLGVPPQDLRSHYADEITGLFDELVDRLAVSRVGS
jgi:chromosome partitioning protein